MCDVTDSKDRIDVTILTGQVKGGLSVPVHQINIRSALYQLFHKMFLMSNHSKM